MLDNALYAFHVVFAVLWVGGMAFAVLVLRPAVAPLPVREKLEVTARAQKCFFLIVWHAMPITLVTGYALLLGYYGGFRGAGWHVHLMHLTGLLMAAIYIAIFFGPWKKMRVALAAGDMGAAATAGAGVRQLVNANLALGLLTVAVASWGRLG